MKHLVLAALLFAGTALPILAQPTWRFHIAFEDGTGARDTIWLVYDVNATTGSNSMPQVDTALGEGRVEMDMGVFNVWRLNWDLDSTKTQALPYTFYPGFEGVSINAFNWEPPMTIRWDTALFHAPYLPYAQGYIGVARMDGEVFFFINNHPELQAYDMLLDDSVFVSTSADFLFPFSVYFGLHNGLSTPEPAIGQLLITPNPAHDRTAIKGEPTVRYTLQLIDVHGGAVLRKVFTGNTDLELGALSAGIYLCRIAGSDGSTAQDRLVIGR